MDWGDTKKDKVKKVADIIGYVLGITGLFLLFSNNTLALWLIGIALVFFDVAQIIELKERREKKKAEKGKTKPKQ